MAIKTLHFNSLAGEQEEQYLLTFEGIQILSQFLFSLLKYEGIYVFPSTCSGTMEDS